MFSREKDVTEIKEFHFHVYWFINDKETKEQAEGMRSEILRLNKEKYFVAIPLDTVNYEPRGPHPIASFEVWVPQEYFAKAYSWFLLNRPLNISVLLHPLTRHELLDHTERAVFLGSSIPLKLSALNTVLPKVPAQYPELELGYSLSINKK
jgi:DOPA 4,5-dioxygenase